MTVDVFLKFLYSPTAHQQPTLDVCFPISPNNKNELSQPLKSSTSLASFTAYAAASPPPGPHVTMSVAGSLAGTDEVLKRYSLGVDEWRETM